MPAHGKPGKPKAGFPPFPPPLESPQKRRASHIPTAPTSGPYIKERLSRPALRPGLKPSFWRVGQNKLPKWAKISCQRQLGLGHYEGRSWRGFHHHATLCIAAYGFLMAERNRFSPPPAPAMLDYQPRSSRPTSARAGRRVRPERHNPRSIATLRIALSRQLLGQLSHCPFCGSKAAG